MFLRLIVASIYLVALGAQENEVAQQNNKIDFEIHAVGFPKDFVFHVELKLKHRVIDSQKVAAKAEAAGGRHVTTQEDYLLDQNSEETHKWDISFNEKGEAKIEGSPQAATFSFLKPVSELSNARPTITLDGKRTVTANGRALGNPSSLGQTRPFKEGTTYVLLLKNQASDGRVSTMTFLLTKEELKDALEGKFPGTNQLPGGMPQPLIGR